MTSIKSDVSIQSCEVVAFQLDNHLCTTTFHEPFQSAYKKGHSTKSALVRVKNDILRPIDDYRCVILLLLDLSAAFDTVDHQILLSRLSSSGIEETVYAWFRSYFLDRKQLQHLLAFN